MTKVLLDQILARGKLSALVVTSSGLAQLPVPGVTIYCAAKSFASFLAVGLSYELAGKVDCMTWEASKMATKLSNAEVGGNVASRPEAVSGMLKHLGSERLTNGCTRHEWDCAILNAIPRSILYEMFRSKLSKIEA